jgi:hypothetical protein
MAALPDAIRAVLENGLPACVITSSADGIPNTTYISQVYYVDGDHIALSHQFFSKTKRNLAANPHAEVWLADIKGSAQWMLATTFDRAETEGPLFDEMDMQLQAIASMQGMSDVFALKAADVFRVHAWERISTSDD